MTRHLRFHGRGGEGVKLSSRIVSRAAFLSGCTVQDSPLYGAERRGAPVVAFTRLSDRPILERGYIDAPDLVVVMDLSLLSHPEAAVLDGVDASTDVVINTAMSSEAVCTQFDIPGIVASYDLSALALEWLGHHLLSAPVAGLTAKVAGICTLAPLLEAVRMELADAGLSTQQIERNVAATQRAFEMARALPISEPRPATQRLRTPRFVFPRMPARLAAPSIAAAATSAQRNTGEWRVYRPQIERQRCTRCFFCFALCPEGAMALDADNYPVVDYAHCKGCLVCVEECPPKAIDSVPDEVAA